MIGDHFMYDFAYILPTLSSSPFALALESAGLFYWFHPARLVVRALVMSAFYLLCGISSSLTRNNAKRGLRLLIVSVGISVVTYVIDIIVGHPYTIILFGTLHMLTVAVFAVAIIELIKSERTKTVLYLASAGIMIALHIIFFCFVKPFPSDLAGVLGFGYPTSYTTDMVGITPFVGIVFIGVVLGKYLKTSNKLSRTLPPPATRPINFVGRYALLTYIVHQPVVLFIIYIISLAG